MIEEHATLFAGASLLGLMLQLLQMLQLLHLPRHIIIAMRFCSVRFCAVLFAVVARPLVAENTRHAATRRTPKGRRTLAKKCQRN